MTYDFGLLIRKLREQKGWTQEALGAKIGVTAAAISQYENNLNVPSADVIAGMATVFGVSMDYLLNIKQRGVLHIGDLPPDVQANLENLVESIRRNQH